jgi:hypothetical protein
MVLLVTDIVLRNNHQKSYFLKLMQLGKQSDHWINLFGVDLPKEEPADSKVAVDNNFDSWFTKIEEVVKEKQVDGKLSQSGKEKLRQYIKRINQSSDTPES